MYQSIFQLWTVPFRIYRGSTCNWKLNSEQCRSQYYSDHTCTGSLRTTLVAKAKHNYRFNYCFQSNHLNFVFRCFFMTKKSFWNIFSMIIWCLTASKHSLLVSSVFYLKGSFGVPYMYLIISDIHYQNGNTNSLQRVIQPVEVMQTNPSIVSKVRNAMIKTLETLFYRFV